MKYKHVTVEFDYDEDSPNPRDAFDHVSVFICPKNSRWMTGGKNDIETDDPAEYVRGLKKQGYLVVEWYSPRVGTCYAVVSPETLKREYTDHGYSRRQALYWARHCSSGEVEEWKCWAEGEVYSYKIVGPDGEVLDSCGGFYGQSYCKQEAEESARYFENEIEADARRVDARLEQVTK